MKKTKKALASLAIAGMTLSLIPFNVFAASPVPTRIAGVTAEQTAVKIADQTGYTGTAVLASSTSYGMVDALTAGPLAASLKAPILLTGAGNTLDAATKAELTKLEVKKVYVTSGTAVIKQGVIDELKAMDIEVVALGGYDRAETSVNIAKQMTGVTKVAIANTVPDALSIAAVASAANQAILLTDKDALPASVASYLSTAGITSSDVIGGTGVISDAVVAGLPGASRHYGMTAYDTNNKVIQDFAASLEFDNIYVANGQTGIDALAGAPLAAQTKSAIVLTDGKTVPAAAAFTYEKSPAGAVVTALGGEAVVPEAVRAGVAAGKVTSEAGELAIVSVSALTDDGRVLSVAFNKAMGPVDKSEVKVFNSKSLARIGVEKVEQSLDGKTLEVTFYDTENAYEIARLTPYTITVKNISFDFSRPGYLDSDSDARVTSVDSDDREIKVTHSYTKTDGTPGTTTKTLEVPENVKINFQEILGQEIRVWFNSDDEVTNYEIQSTAVYDAIEITEKDELETINEEVEYDLATNVKLIVNYEAGSTHGEKEYNGYTGTDAIEDALGEYDYAKLVLNSDGDVEYIYAYQFTSNPILVENVDDTYIVGFDGDELDLEDYIIVKDGKEIAIEDIEAKDLVFFNKYANGGDGLAVVYTGSITGEIDKVFETSFDVDGENYKFTNAYGAVKYLDADGDFVNIDEDAAEQLQDGGIVTLYTNFKGQLIYVTGDASEIATQSNALYLQAAPLAYLNTKLDGQLEIDAIDTEGESVNYDFAINDLDEITVFKAAAGGKAQKLKFEQDDVSPVKASTKVDKFILAKDAAGTPSTTNGDALFIVAVNKDGSKSEVLQLSKLAVDVDSTGLFKTNNVISAVKDDEGTLVGLKFYDDAYTVIDGTNAFDEDAKYAAGYSLQDSTVVYDLSDVTQSLAGLSDPDEDDVSVTTWGALKEDKVDINQALVYYDEDGKVTSIVTYNDTITDDATFTAVVIDTDVSNSKIVRLEALVDGDKVTYDVDNETAAGFITPGAVVEISVNAAGNLVTKFTDISSRTVSGVVDKIDMSENTIKLVGGAEYQLSANGDVYDATDADADDYTAEALRDIEEDDAVLIVLPSVGSHFADAVVMVTVDGALENAEDAAALLDSADYTVASWATLTAALAMDDTTNAEIVAKTAAINSAITGLVNKVVTSTTVAGSATIAIGAGDVTAVYVATVKDQAGTAMTTETVTWSVIDVTGTPVGGADVSIAADGTVTVKNTANSGDKFRVVATSDTDNAVVGSIDVTIQ